jgi:hypothetical protein
MRSTRGDVRDHIDLHKHNREPSYGSQRAAQRPRDLTVDLREIFGAVRADIWVLWNDWVLLGSRRRD